MKRRMFSILSVLSLVLCLPMCGLLLFGSRYVVIARAGGDRWAISVGLHDNGLFITIRRNDDPDIVWEPGIRTLSYDLRSYSGPARNAEELSVLYRPRVGQTFLGFGFQRDHEIGCRRNWIARVPYAFIILTLAICPVRWIATSRKSRIIPRHICGKCGYDLRASKDRCPECGTAIHASAVKKHLATD